MVVHISKLLNTKENSRHNNSCLLLLDKLCPYCNAPRYLTKTSFTHDVKGRRAPNVKQVCDIHGNKLLK